MYLSYHGKYIIIILVKQITGYDIFLASYNELLVFYCIFLTP